MSGHETGGPAFPQMDAYVDVNGERPVYVADGGMTLRDYFAAKAPPYPDNWFNQYCQTKGFTSEARAQADWSYHYADAMLAARGDA